MDQRERELNELTEALIFRLRSISTEHQDRFRREPLAPDSFARGLVHELSREVHAGGSAWIFGKDKGNGAEA